MNREIKFRAWDTSDKEKGPYMLGPYDLTDTIFNHKEVRKMQLMQFTGLKDKNGKEIYEGDIVSHLHSADTCVVVFQKETAMFLAQEISDEKLGFGIEDVTEVIGNIYENADLLSELS